MGETVGWWNKIPTKLYFRLKGVKGEDMWFGIKSSYWSFSSTYAFSKGRETIKQALPSLRLTLAPHIREPKFASVGSIIYASGGLDHSPFVPSSEVFCIDTRHPEEGWKAAAPMIMKRLYHYMLADSGKIYVVGGLIVQHTSVSTDKKKLYAEVYDPYSNLWEELAWLGEDEMASLPRQHIDGHAAVADGELDKKILFYRYSTKRLLYINTIRKDDVGIYAESFRGFHPPSAFLDGVLHTFNGKDIYAYDVSACNRCKVVLRDIKTNTLPVQGLDEGIPTRLLISLGNGYLALIWAPNRQIHSELRVTCSMIEMSRVGKTFEGKVLHCLTFYVQNGSLNGGLAVFSRDVNVSSEADLDEKTESSDKKAAVEEKVETDSTQHINK